ncbi:hypothetical protein ABH935_007720 [Catenulispora sp. GAS73]|uniref:hypothetical protein n=1 Tax=Catenulispora sp. GAS73 TaxID=3156269 RepID=UPI0035125712
MGTFQSADPNYPIGTNVSVAATMYSTAAGIMCGFAFTAIVLLVVTWLTDSSRAQRVLAATGRALIASFFGLLIMCVLYASLSASAVSSGQAISDNTILTDGFGSVGIILVYSVVLMLEAADEGTDPPSDRGRDLAKFARAFACVLNLLIVGMVYEAVEDYLSIRYGQSHPITGINVLAWSLLGTQLIVACRSAWITTRREQAGRCFKNRDKTTRRVVHIGLGLTVASAVSYMAADSTLSTASTIAPAVVVLVLVAAFGFACGTTLHLALTRMGTSVDTMPPDAPSGAGTQPPAAVHIADGDFQDLVASVGTGNGLAPKTGANQREIEIAHLTAVLAAAVAGLAIGRLRTWARSRAQAVSRSGRP